MKKTYRIDGFTPEEIREANSKPIIYVKRTLEEPAHFLVKTGSLDRNAVQAYKIESLGDFAKRRGLHQYAIQLIKEALQISDDFYRVVRYSTCAVCGKKLSTDDHNAKTSFDVQSVCLDHRAFAPVFQLELALKLNGITEAVQYDVWQTTPDL